MGEVHHKVFCLRDIVFQGLIHIFEKTLFIDFKCLFIKHKFHFFDRSARQNKSLRVDRIGRIRHNGHITRVCNGLYKVYIALFTSHGCHHFCVRVKVNIVFTFIPVTHGKTQFINTFTRRVTMCLLTCCFT